MIARYERELRARVGSVGEIALGIDGPAARAFHEFIIGEYTPPADKRLLVFLQCSVRRPFSSSPSHASMRRAIALATGFQPRKEFESCPVHVVVLASQVGPVPYELENVPPASIRSGGVKHFSPEQYWQARPVLASRMAEYLLAHGDSYDHVASFTEGRYAEVMMDARRIAGRDFPILPVIPGPAIRRMGRSYPRTYWQRYWIQLYLEVVSWLSPGEQARAAARLERAQVECFGRQ